MLLQGWIGNFNGRDWIVSPPMWPPEVDDRLYERPDENRMEAIQAVLGPNPNAQGEGEA